MLEEFCDSLPTGALVVEAGAYHGEDTVRLAERVGFVHAFEPVSFSQLVSASLGYPNVVPWNLALADELGEQEIWVSGGPHSAASSLLEPTGHLSVLPDITFGERKMVETTTLEDWATRSLSAPIDGLWLDLQGMELAVMKAAGSVLDTVTSIVLEVSHSELYDGMPLAPEVWAWLLDQRFQMELDEGIGAEQSNWLVTRG